MSASRLKGKPLLEINNLPIICHVVKKAKETGIGKVIVATEDEEIVARLQPVNSEDDYASAKITLNVNGKDIQSEATGDGMIDAAFTAVKSILKSDAKLIDYRVESITTGSDATAEIITIVNDGHLMKQGRSVSTDVVQGSVIAFLDALNKQ